MLKISAVRAALGKSVSAKLKNSKDDSERVIEFALEELSLTQQQLSDLVACSEHERTFAQVAFVSLDSISELRHFKKLEIASEVHNATLVIDKIGTSGTKLKLAGCSLKGIALSFSAGERCEMSCKVWAPLEEHALFQLGAWSTHDVFVAIDSPKHGEEDASPTRDLDLAGGGASVNQTH